MATPAALKAMVKRLGPEDRAHLTASLALYYDDRGMMFSPQITRRRKRVTIDEVALLAGEDSNAVTAD
ncbi:MAG TPA: hypothetical protein VMT95_03205 [Candidatus Binatia bacterium]|nr:hypothetical protein [Candidatus Binatia bacterium]